MCYWKYFCLNQFSIKNSLIFVTKSNWKISENVYLNIKNVEL